MTVASTEILKFNEPRRGAECLSVRFKLDGEAASTSLCLSPMDQTKTRKTIPVVIDSL